MRNAISDEPTKEANAVNLGANATAFCCAIDDILFVVLYCIVLSIVLVFVVSIMWAMLCLNTQKLILKYLSYTIFAEPISEDDMVSILRRSILSIGEYNTRTQYLLQHVVDLALRRTNLDAT